MNKLDIVLKKIKRYDKDTWFGFLAVNEQKVLLANGATQKKKIKGVNESLNWFYFTANDSLSDKLYEDKALTVTPEIEKAIREKVSLLANKINKAISEGRQINPNEKLAKEYEMQKRLLGIVLEDKARKKFKSIPIRKVHESEKNKNKEDKKDKVKESKNLEINARLDSIKLKKTYMPPLKESRIVKFYTLESLLKEDAYDEDDLRQRLLTLRQLIDDPKVDTATKQYAKKQYAKLQASKSASAGAPAMAPKTKPMGI